jgi:hypothetical protein
MGQWLIVLGFLVLLLGTAWWTDSRSRRKRRGLDRYSTSTPTSDSLDAANRSRAQNASEVNPFGN